MATIINMSGGSISPVLLASVTSVPTSSTEIAGTENWKKYGAIYFVVKMHYNDKDNVVSFTNLILTKSVVNGVKYCVVRQSSASNNAEAGLSCLFYDDQIKILKNVIPGYDIMGVDIYGVNF